MATTLNPYLTFDGDAREAMEFYAAAFGGDLEVSTFGEYGDAPNADGVMHAQLETPSGFTLMASDLPPGMGRTSGNDIAISLSGDDADELRGYWKHLSEAGEVTMPLATQVWGDEFGMCTDRYGVSWMVNIVSSTDGRPTTE